MTRDLGSAVEQIETQKRIANLELMVATLIERITVLEVQQKKRPPRVDTKKVFSTPRTDRISVSMHPELKEAIRNEAAMRDISISEWIENAALAQLDWKDP